MTTSLPGPDGRLRCHWCMATPDYLAYHDHEWGFPVGDDRDLFEKLCLEGFQSGLSWRTILNKRDNFRAAFHNFDYHRIAAFTDADIERLLQNEGIIRHRGKIAAAINNARRMQELVAQEGSLAAYIWRFEPPTDTPATPQAQPATTPASEMLAKDLKRRGWAFVGPTTAYAFMQAMGLVNDHAATCVIRAEATRARAAFTVPGIASAKPAPLDLPVHERSPSGTGQQAARKRKSRHDG